MRTIRAALLVAVLAGVAGCGTPPPLQGPRPVPAPNQGYGLAKSEVVARTDHMTQRLDDTANVMYFQNQGGGGVGVGLLLGPLGVLANIKMIEGATTFDVDKLKGKTRLNPEAAFDEAAAATRFAVSPVARPADVKVTPYVLISKTSETTLNASSMLLFEGMDDQKKWIRRYQFQLPGSWTVEQLAALSPAQSGELQAASVRGFAALLAHIESETTASIASEPKITFKSAFMSPRFEFEMLGSLAAEKEGRVWVRTFGIVSAVAPSDIQYKKAAP